MTDLSERSAPDPDPTSSAAGTVPPHLADALRVLAAGTAQVLPHDGLAEKLRAADREGRPLRVKLGIDPSGTDLTLGHAVVLRKLRQFQDLGHLAVLIVGDFTGQVGDPSGRTATRAALTREQTDANSAGYLAQLMRVLDPDRVEIRRNSEWLAPMTMAEVLENSRHLTVAQLLERDDFARRFREKLPISLMEFSYPLLQGLDSVAVCADVELGGTDQTYNNLVGRELQRAHGQAPQIVLTVPLLVGLDGVEKMGKSLGNYVAIDEPAPEQFGKLMSLPDDAVGTYAELCAAMPPDRVEELTAAAASGGRSAGMAKRQMARAVVALYHGADAAQHAEDRFDAVFRSHGVPDDLAEHQLADDDSVHLPALLRAVGFVPSTSAGRRLVDDGAVRLDDVPVAAGSYDIARAEVLDRVLRVGRRRMIRLRAGAGDR